MIRTRRRKHRKFDNRSERTSLVLIAHETLCDRVDWVEYEQLGNACQSPFVCQSPLPASVDMRPTRGARAEDTRGAGILSRASDGSHVEELEMEGGNKSSKRGKAELRLRIKFSSFDSFRSFNVR